MNGTIHSYLVVLGATSAVGRGVVRAAVEVGLPVIVVDPDIEALQRLRVESADPQMTLVAGSVAVEAEADALAARLREIGIPLSGIAMTVPVIAERGRVLDFSADQLRHAFDSALLPYLTAARHLLPLLAESGRGGGLILVGAAGGDQPWAGYGHRSIVAAALRMLAAVLHEEARSLHVRVQLLAPEKPLRSECGPGEGCSRWPTALDVGRRVIDVLRRDESVEPTRAVIDYASPEWLAAAVHAVAAETTVRAAYAPPPGAPRALRNASPSARCLSDARTLLRSLIPSKRSQET